MENDELKFVTENLYKQNLELAVKNKTLSLLDKLYSISILALQPKNLAERVNSTIQIDFNFELVGIFLYQEEKDILSPLYFSKSDRLHKVESSFNISLDSIPITNVSKNTFLNKIFKDKSMVYTEELTDVWDSLVSKEIFNKIKSDGHIESSILYPLIIENKPIGVLLLSLNRKYSELVQYEKDSIGAFINVISVALDKSMLYEQLTNTNEKLKIANENQASLMHFMNHQVKGRLGNAKNIFAELLTDDYGTISDFARPLLQKGLEETDLGVTYVQNILKGSSAENGTLPYEMKQMNFKDVVEKVVAEQKTFVEAKGLKFSLKVSDGDYGMTGDSLELSEAVKNMIDNSVNYTPSGSVAIELSQTGKKIKLSIKDTGVGIAEEDKSRLFKSGGRGADSLKVNTNSTGYGLVFVKGVVEAHKGRVWVESEGRDKGATFYLELPIQI